MKINELIKTTTKELIPLKKLMMSNNEITHEQNDMYFNLNTALDLYKLLKGAFMEEITKNKEVIPTMVKLGIITMIEKEAEKDGKIIKVHAVAEPMDYQIDNLPEKYQDSIIEKMVKAHKENIKIYENTKASEKTSVEDIKKIQNAYKKETYELSILDGFLPKEATREDVMTYLNEYYNNGIERQFMGKVIGEVKKAFKRVDGKLVAECVNSIIK